MKYKQIKKRDNIIFLNIRINIQNRSFEYYTDFQYKPKSYILHHISYTYLNIIFLCIMSFYT